MPSSASDSQPSESGARTAPLRTGGPKPPRFRSLAPRRGFAHGWARPVGRTRQLEIRDGFPAELAEVPQALVPPGDRVLRLLAQLPEHGPVALVVHFALKRPPPGLELSSLLRALGVLAHQLLPERASRLHQVAPAQPVEPQQEGLRAGGRVAPVLAHGCAVLIEGAAALPRAVVADAAGVGPVIVEGRPVGAAGVRVLGHRGVMVAADQVVEAEGHGVADERLARVEHHRADRVDDHRILSPGHPDPPRRDRGPRPGGRRRTSSPARSGARTS